MVRVAGVAGNLLNVKEETQKFSGIGIITVFAIEDHV